MSGKNSRQASSSLMSFYLQVGTLLCRGQCGTIVHGEWCEMYGVCAIFRMVRYAARSSGMGFSGIFLTITCLPFCIKNCSDGTDEWTGAIQLVHYPLISIIIPKNIPKNFFSLLEEAVLLRCAQLFWSVFTIDGNFPFFFRGVCSSPIHVFLFEVQ